MSEESRRARNGAYPAPPYWPKRLTGGTWTPWDIFSALCESKDVLHTYVMDGWPGPCAMAFANDEFYDWWPALTIERAEGYAARA